MHFIELAKGFVNHRGVIVGSHKLEKEIEQNRKDKGVLYHSIFQYDESVAEHFLRYKTIKSFKGKRKLPFLIFDIDIKEDTDEFVLQRAKQFVTTLEDDFGVGREELEFWYSGRGYHIYMPDYFKFEESFVCQVEVRNTINEYFPEVDMALYTASSLIRAPYSLNTKSKRYKIPLSYEEFTTLSAKEIIELAGSNEIREGIDSMEPDPKKNWTNKIVQAPTERQKVAHRDEPTRIVTCMQKLFLEGGEEGSRHVKGMRLVSSWRRMGQTKEASVTLLSEWAPSLSKYEIQRIVNDIYEKGYVYSCHDSVMVKYCDPKCIYYQNKDYSSGTQSKQQVLGMLKDSVQMKRLGKEIDFQKILNLPVPYKAYLGELVVVWGDTKLGKSTLIQNIVSSTRNLRWLYLPLENGIALDARRFMQINSGLPKERVEEIVELGSEEEQVRLLKSFDHIEFSEDAVTINAIRRLTSEQNFDAVVIDTVDQLKSTDKDYNANIRNLTIGLRDFTRSMKKLVIVIHHIGKGRAEDQEGNRRKLTIHGGLGSSALEQKADKVIGIEGDRDKEVRIISSLGARDETSFTAQVYFNQKNFRLTPIAGQGEK